MSKETKTTSESKPPEWSEPLFKQSAAEASKLYDSGSGANPYLGSTVADMSDTSLQGINQLAQAGANWDTAGSRPLFQGIGAGAGGIYDAASGPSYSESNLADYASGKYLDPATNPYFEPALQGQLDKTADQIQSVFSGAGRYGSGANTGVLTNELGNLRTNAFADQFNRNVASQFTANQLMDAGRNANFGTQLSALGAGQTAANSIAGLDQQNFQNRLSGADATVKAGNMLDTFNQAKLTDEVNLYNQLDNADWTRLGLLQAAAAGSSGNYGTQVATSRQPVNPFGAIGSLLGNPGLFAGKSDIRLKENIVHIGRANGINVYEFSYRGQKARWMGVMAQELPLGSRAVRMDGDGFLSVDYAELGFPMTRAA